MKLCVIASFAVVLWGCQREIHISSPVKTLNPGYNRMSSRALVREVASPTRANLDYAVYSADVMLWNAPGDTVRLPHGVTREDLRFGDFLGEIHPDVGDIPVTEVERASPLHWKPVLEYLLEQAFDEARSLAEGYGKVTAERFGFSGDVPAPLIEFADLYLATKDSSVWIKIECKPWMLPMPEGLHDGDGDGVPEGFARLDASKFTPKLFSLLRGEYASKVLTEAEVIDWGHQLAAYWYPSRNTDFQDLRGLGSWPGEAVEAEVKREFPGRNFPQPVFALRGKPHGQPVYFVLAVPGMGVKSPPTPQGGKEGNQSNGPVSVSDNIGEYLASIRDREKSLLTKQGKGSWDRWRGKLAPYHREVSALLATQPASVMALPGRKAFLLFRRELEYLLADDLQKLPPEKNPLAAIASLRDSLAALGIDFLFVPIPTKLDVYPGLVSASGVKLPGGTTQPFFRKVLLDLAGKQVETVDLLTPFQEAAHGGDDSVYQRQDTHWTAHGLETVAKTLAERVMGYAWFGEAYPEEIHYSVRDTVFSQLGDLYDRLPSDARSGIRPEVLSARRVLLPDGQLYQDRPDAPVLVLGDSYTGVFELTGCRNAGVTAHLAKGLAGPVDLIMGWGGGPEAPNKLRRAGPEALKGKRLVIWMMSVRDLFVYPGGWGGR